MRPDNLSTFARIQRIHHRLLEALLKDAWEISRRLKALNATAGNTAVDQRTLKQLSSIERRLATSIQRREERLTHRPQLNYAENLPIFAKRDDIVRAIREYPVVIVSGDTGCGKSTQIPRMCLEAGRGIAGKIGCTQPRRIAAFSVARRIAEEMGEEIGGSVGYKIRFTDRTSPDAYIKIMTDGILLAETQQDPFLTEYDTIIIDEAHERSMNIDFLLGILQTLQPKRKDLRVVVTSATIDTEKFSAAFNRAPVIQVEGRTYPVEVEYLPIDRKLEEAGEVTYVDMAVRAVEQMRKTRPPGDFLIFMPTEQDIRETRDLLEGRKFSETTVLPLFARLTTAQQRKVFSSFSGRKIVVATNVAETSITIPGIKYVVDTGLARIPKYLPRSRTTSLPISPVSKSSADQRKGRSGRVENGVCIRLYSEEDYASRPEFTPPEILRSNLAEVILRMLSLNLGDIESFPFIDRPNPKSIKDGFDLLLELGAIKRKGKSFTVTENGRFMARMPMDPQISRMILEAWKEHCVPEVAIIGSALSIQDPRERPVEKVAHADQMHAQFKDEDSDFITLLNIWSRYHRRWNQLKTQSRMRKFCKEHFLSFVRIREWRDIREQISDILREQGIKTGIEGIDFDPSLNYAAIHRSILSGYLSNIAVKKDKNIYLAAKGREVMLFPGSTLFNRGSPWVVAAEIVKTSRLFARTVARIEPKWLEALGGEICKSSYAEPHWDKNLGEVRAFQTVTLHGLVIVSGRPVSYGPIHPNKAHRIFVQSALVEGEVTGSFPFLEHNYRLWQKMSSFEHKLRRKDILVSEETLADFYSRRLPGVYDIRTLNKRIKEIGSDDFLKLREEDILISHPDETELRGYPDLISIGGQDFQLSYTFAPGTEEDGVTITVPSTMASGFPSDRLDWLVPGMLKEKITAMIKGLPKRHRKQIIPVSKTVEIIGAEMERSDEPLITALARFVYQRFGKDIPASQWPTNEIPDHLKMRIQVIDHDGHALRSGRDAKILRQSGKRPSLVEKEPGAWKDARERWEKSSITSWNFNALPEQIPLGTNLVGHIGLQPEEGFVNIRLFTSAEEALENHMRGVERLLSIHLSKDLKFLKRILKLSQLQTRFVAYFGGPDKIEKDLYEILLHRLFRVNVRDRKSFHALAEAVRKRLISEGKSLLAAVEKVLDAHYQTRLTIQSIETGINSNQGVLDLCKGIRKELDHLIPRDFLSRYDPGSLSNLPRYLKALELRAQRGSNDLDKDARKAAELKIFVTALERIEAKLSPHATEEKKKALVEYRWMIEEFKVSLFAQELKTPYPVSAKRLDKKLGEIQRMI